MIFLMFLTVFIFFTCLSFLALTTIIVIITARTSMARIIHNGTMLLENGPMSSFDLASASSGGWLPANLGFVRF